MGFLSHQGNGSLIVLCNGVVSCSVERQDFLPADGKSLFFVDIYFSLLSQGEDGISIRLGEKFNRREEKCLGFPLRMICRRLID